VYAYTSGDPLTQVDVRGLGCGPERRVWSEEELAAARELIDKKLQHAPPYPVVGGAPSLTEMAKRPVTFNPRQAALHAALSDPKSRVPGSFYPAHYPHSRIPLEQPINSADLHALTGHTGLEHGVVRDADGKLWITRGDPNAPASPKPGEEVLVHTHPHDTPPSPGDLKHGPAQGGAVIGPDGRVTDFDRNGQNPHATQSPIAEDGTIDGNYHPITPIVSEVE
jgi:hypothetical protein